MALVVLLAKLTLSVLFLVAAAGKLLGGFANSRKSLSDFGLPVWLSGPLSYALPFAELAAAGMLFVNYSAWAGAIGATALLCIFNAAIAANLAVGKKPKCNCFGQLHSTPISWWTFLRNGVLIALGSWLIWEIPRQPNVTLVGLLKGLSTGEIVALSIGFVGLLAIAGEGILVLHALKQNGRLLLRIEALEAKAALTQHPQMPVRQALHGLPIGTKAIPFDLPKAKGGRATLDSFLSEGKPVLLISTDPNCGPCNALMPDVANWQKSLAVELNVVLLSHGRESDNRAKAKEHGLENVLVEKDHKIAEQYEALGTPTALLIKADGTIGSPAMGGADGIRQLINTKAWTETGFAAFMLGLGHPPQPPAPKPKVPIGAEAPAFTLPDLDGSTIHSVNFNGTGTVLLFWNPACGFCQKMLPQLKEWESAKPATAPRLMLVSTGSRESNRTMSLESTVLIDDKFAVGQLFGANGTPSAVLINGEGKIASGLAVGAPRVFELLNGKIVLASEPELARPRSKSAKAASQ
jgi:peroxiredoxin